MSVHHCRVLKRLASPPYVMLCKTRARSAGGRDRGGHQKAEEPIRVAWLQLRNSRNSPCKHLMLGRSPQILSPRVYHPLLRHQKGGLFITSGPRMFTRLLFLRPLEAHCSLAGGLPLTCSSTNFNTPAAGKQTPPDRTVPSTMALKRQHLQRERSVSSFASLRSDGTIWV